jgi:RNA polymerase sigma-70 factor (ECF subfamily)
VNATSDVFYDTASREAAPGFETLFYAHHDRITRLIARVIRDPGRAEEIALEVFWKFWRTPKAHGPAASAWLHRAAVRMSLNELRRRIRSTRRENLAPTAPGPANPEEQLAALREQQQVRAVLAHLSPRDAEMLLLRSAGLSYEELAAALELKAASVGTLLSRAQQAFRKAYVKRYGEQNNER